MWNVRAEIVGEFVVVERFRWLHEALSYCDKLKVQGIWDSIEFWEV